MAAYKVRLENCAVDASVNRAWFAVYGFDQSQGTREHIPGVGTNRRGLESIFQGLEPITGRRTRLSRSPTSPHVKHTMGMCVFPSHFGQNQSSSGGSCEAETSLFDPGVLKEEPNDNRQTPMPSTALTEVVCTTQTLRKTALKCPFLRPTSPASVSSRSLQTLSEAPRGVTLVDMRERDCVVTVVDEMGFVIPEVGTNRRALESIFQGLGPIAGD
eukprot:1181130-Prorocentrum_minimum.AAC.1